jgi:hypothetical protein
MALAAALSRERSEIKAVTATGVQNYVTRRGSCQFGDAIEKRPSDSAIMQAPPCRDGRRRVTRLPGPAVLRLQQVDVTAARDVEGMSARAHQPPAAFVDAR